MPKFSVVRGDHTFTDPEGVRVHYYTWLSAKPKGVVQIAHGLGEYAGRYEALAQALVNAGYSVYADDHRGHGATGVEQHGGDLSKLGRLGPGGLTATIADIRQLTSIAKNQNAGLPLVLLGHSWGSLMAQKIVNENVDAYDAIVLTGTAYRMPGAMNGGNLNNLHKHLGTTGYEWLSRDTKVSQAFLDDPLTFYADVLKLFGLPDGLRLFGRPSKNVSKDLPLLIMIGSEDSLGGEKSVHTLAEKYLSRSGLTDVQVVIYKDARHEIFNETNKEEVYADLIAWLDSRVPVA
jgi:alpha-beta hydrolase superfamily lysophospholipase